MTSFPKARIHRFNEDMSCAPPPGTYDPKLDTGVKGCPIQKGKRFPDQQCESKSLDNINKSNNTEMNFRTPQVRKRIVKVTPQVHEEIKKMYDTLGSSSSTSSSDKIFKTPQSSMTRMDCRRLEQKLTTLADSHLAEINELHSEIAKLEEDLSEVNRRENEIKEILKEKNIVELERRNEILCVKKNLDIVEDKLRNERELNTKYIDELKSQISLLETEKEDLKGIIAEKQSVIMTINDRYIHLEKELQLIREENETFKQEIEFIEEKGSEIIKTLVVESENKIDQLEQTLNGKVSSLEKDFNDAQEKAQAKFQTYINYITHEFDTKTQEYKDQLNTYFIKYEELKKLVDQNEKEYLEQVKEVDDRCEILSRELCSIESQRDELLVSDLEKKLSMVQENSLSIEKDLKSYKEKCKNYEITLSTMQKTITALGDRLLESENEVIRLNSVEVELESQKKSLEDKSQLLASSVLALRESMGKMEQEIITDVLVMKEHLAAEVDKFKIESAKQVDLLNENIYDKQCTIDGLLSELNNAMISIKEFKCEKLNYENEIGDLKNKIKDLNLDAENKIMELKMTNKLLSNTKEDLESKIGTLQCTLDDFIEKINNKESKFAIKISCLEAEKSSLSLQLDEAKKTISDLENVRAEKNMIINELSEQIDTEKAKYNDYVFEVGKTFVTFKKHNEVLKINADSGIKLQEAEEKINNLEGELRTLQIKYDKSKLRDVETQKLQDELEAMRLKLQVVTDDRNKLDQELAELMGHQNIHQKIKHINQLKQQKLEIRERAEQLEIENKLLKKKLAEIKENTNPSLVESSPKMKTNKNKKISSPGVLKDRN